MNSLILYSSLKPLTGMHQPISTSEGTIYIRVETFFGGVGEALDKASPLEGETVLNTIPSPAADHGLA